MYGCESWTIKKAACQRIDAFELWCWRRLLRVPWTARRSNQSILKEISPEHSLKHWCWSWNSNTLTTWCKEGTHRKRPWCWERLKAVREGDKRGWDGWMASPTWWTWLWASSGSWWWTRKPVLLQSMGSQRAGHKWTTEQQQLTFSALWLTRSLHTIYIIPLTTLYSACCLALNHVWLLMTPWTVARQAPLSMGFSREEYWSGLPFSSPGDLPNPGIEPGSPALQADSLLTEPPGKQAL